MIACPVPVYRVSVTQVKLRSMTRAEYDAWSPRAIAEYANDHVRAMSMPQDRAQEMAEEQFVDLLPDGPATAEHHLLVPEIDGASIGSLWLHLPVDSDNRMAFVFDVEVTQVLRGRGFGRAVMIAAEDYARARGAASMRLHVFGDNVAARGLYESLGFTVTNVMMAKPFDNADA